MEEAIIKRVMPHSAEAEQSVIAAMLMDRDAIMSASEILAPEDFYQRQYGVIFEAMVEIFNEDKPVDLVILQEYGVCAGAAGQRLRIGKRQILRQYCGGKGSDAQAHSAQRGDFQRVL